MLTNNLANPFGPSYHLWRNWADGKLHEKYLWRRFILSKVAAH